MNGCVSATKCFTKKGFFHLTSFVHVARIIFENSPWTNQLIRSFKSRPSRVSVVKTFDTLGQIVKEVLRRNSSLDLGARGAAP